MRASQRIIGYRGVQVLAYVQDTIASEGRAPSYRMIRDQLGICDKGDVGKIVKRLEQRGLLSRTGNGRVHRIRMG